MYERECARMIAESLAISCITADRATRQQGEQLSRALAPARAKELGTSVDTVRLMRVSFCFLECNLVKLQSSVWSHPPFALNQA